MPSDWRCISLHTCQIWKTVSTLYIYILACRPPNQNCTCISIGAKLAGAAGAGAPVVFLV